ncbi:MAG TPA: chemotaxis-specific protein-glutamate methyltransferase CheB [Edaphobacter sp.]|jgi:two-component system chemotaxis response regulator CheB|nr:chemotaxis-specific protein-glutamate methyltransferase CheB [Edaphobacter sp.]
MGTSKKRPLRILAADDSAVMRSILWKLFLMHAEDRSSELPRMELCGIARDGVECLELMRQQCPDVLVLDLEMPRMNGLDVLDRLRTENPELPVIMCSAYTEHGARSTLEALGRGASDYVMKPSQQQDFAAAMQSLSQQLLPRIVALAKNASGGIEKTDRNLLPDPLNEKAGHASTAISSTIEVVVIGLSTGGPLALEQLLPKLPKDFPVPVLIVQHMPKLFTGALAERLDNCCALRVEQAYDNAVIRPGTVWLAPGDAHMEVAPRRAMMSDGDRGEAHSSRVRLHQQEPLNHCRPSVDYLFLSAARMYGAGTLALVMTGMGADGLNGARAVHQGGGVVLAQDEATSAVWGMPGRVTEAGIASLTLPLWGIASALKQRVGAGRRTKPDSAAPVPAAAPRREMIHGLL